MDQGTLYFIGGLVGGIIVTLVGQLVTDLLSHGETEAGRFFVKRNVRIVWESRVRPSVSGAKAGAKQDKGTRAFLLFLRVENLRGLGARDLDAISCEERSPDGEVSFWRSHAIDDTLPVRKEEPASWFVEGDTEMRSGREGAFHGPASKALPIFRALDFRFFYTRENDSRVRLHVTDGRPAELYPMSHEFDLKISFKLERNGRASIPVSRRYLITFAKWDSPVIRWVRTEERGTQRPITTVWGNCDWNHRRILKCDCHQCVDRRKRAPTV